jgi:hypothetical protein
MHKPKDLIDWVLIAVMVLCAFRLLGDGGVLPTPLPEPGPRRVIVIRETENQSSQQAMTLTALRRHLKAKGHDWRIEDPDVSTNRDEVPEWMSFAMGEASTRNVLPPFILIAAGSRVLTVEALPATPEGAVELMGRYGG